jgi:hypothetical protein
MIKINIFKNKKILYLINEDDDELFGTASYIEKIKNEFMKKKLLVYCL